MPACLNTVYSPATTTPRIINEKNPGTIFNTDAPHEDAFANALLVAEAVLTSVEIGPIRLTPIKTAIKIVINTAIILSYLSGSSIDFITKMYF